MSIASRILRTAYKSVGNWIVDGKMWSIEASELKGGSSSNIVFNSKTNITLDIPTVGKVELKFSHRNKSGDEIVAWIYDPVDKNMKNQVHGVIILND